MENTSKTGVFRYGDLRSYYKLVDIFNMSNYHFLDENHPLIRSDALERAICVAFKPHLEAQLQRNGVTGYFVDIDYNANGQIETMLNFNTEIVDVKSDLVVHSRGSLEQDNLIAFEITKSYRSQESKNADRKRLRALTQCEKNLGVSSYDGKTLPEKVCRYILGVYYEIDLGNKTLQMEFYRDGNMWSMANFPIFFRKR